VQCAVSFQRQFCLFLLFVTDINVNFDDDVNVLTVAENFKTRGHSMKLMKYHCSIDVTKYYFSNHIVHTWNSLPNDIVSAPSVSSFKSRLLKFELSI